MLHLGTATSRLITILFMVLDRKRTLARCCPLSGMMSDQFVFLHGDVFEQFKECQSYICVEGEVKIDILADPQPQNHKKKKLCKSNFF